jgi:hypothetical protein
MKKRFVIIVLTVACADVMNAQINTQWIRQSVDSSMQDGGAVAIDRNNNVYLSGEFETLNSNNFLIFGRDSMKSLSSQDFLVKFDEYGNEKWLKGSRVNSQNSYSVGLALATDNANNIYETGEMMDTIYFGTDTIIGKGENIYIVKYDSNGKSLWARAPLIPHAGTYNQPYGITTDKKNNVYVTGTFQDTMHFGAVTLVPSASYSIFLVKYDANGNFLWAKTPISDSASDYDISYSVFTDPNNDVYISGASSSAKLIFDSKIFAGPNSFLVKYDSAGNALWAKNSYGGCYGVLSNNNYIYLTGGFADTIVIKKDTLRSNQYGSMIILKCDTSGSVIWAKQAKPIIPLANTNPAFGTAIATDNCDNIVVTGPCTAATITIDTATYSTIAEPSGEQDQTFLVELDSAGNLKGGLAMPDGGDDNIYLTCDKANNFLLGEDIAYENLVFGSDTAFVKSAETIDVIKFFIGKPCNGVESIKEIESKNLSTALFPNPNNGRFTIELQGVRDKEQVEIYNMLGEKVYSQSFSTLHSQFSIDLGGKSPGVYLYRLVSETGAQIANGKFVIE